MKVFPAEIIGIDKQGGGVAIEEALHDPDKLQPGEHLLWPIIDPKKDKDTDIEPGLHILNWYNSLRPTGHRRLITD